MLQNLSYNLKDLKEKSGLTTLQISELSGVPESTVKRILSGATDNPSFSNVADIVLALGGSLDELVGIKVPEDGKGNISVTRELIESYKRLASDKDRQILHKDKWLHKLFIILCGIGIFLMAIVLIDIFHGNIGYIRYQ